MAVGAGCCQGGFYVPRWQILRCLIFREGLKVKGVPARGTKCSLWSSLTQTISGFSDCALANAMGRVLNFSVVF